MMCLGIVFAFAAAFSACIGAVLAAPIVPPFFAAIQKIALTLSSFFRSHGELVSLLREDLAKNGSITCVETPELEAALVNLSESLPGPEWCSDVMNFADVSAKAGTARAYLVLSFILALFSAVFQVWAVVCGPDGPANPMVQ